MTFEAGRSTVCASYQVTVSAQISPSLPYFVVLELASANDSLLSASRMSALSGAWLRGQAFSSLPVLVLYYAYSLQEPVARAEELRAEELWSAPLPCSLRPGALSSASLPPPSGNGKVLQNSPVHALHVFVVVAVLPPQGCMFLGWPHTFDRIRISVLDWTTLFIVQPSYR